MPRWGSLKAEPERLGCTQLIEGGVFLGEGSEGSRTRQEEKLSKDVLSAAV